MSPSCAARWPTCGGWGRERSAVARKGGSYPCGPSQSASRKLGRQPQRLALMWHARAPNTLLRNATPLAAPQTRSLTAHLHCDGFRRCRRGLGAAALQVGRGVRTVGAVGAAVAAACALHLCRLTLQAVQLAVAGVAEPTGGAKRAGGVSGWPTAHARAGELQREQILGSRRGPRPYRLNWLCRGPGGPGEAGGGRRHPGRAQQPLPAAAAPAASGAQIPLR